jgi:hypothetical protein
LADIIKGIQQLVTLFESAVDKNFDKFELYALKNIFNLSTGQEIKLQHESYGGSVDEDTFLDTALEEKREALLKVGVWSLTFCQQEYNRTK